MSKRQPRKRRGIVPVSDMTQITVPWWEVEPHAAFIVEIPWDKNAPRRFAAIKRPNVDDREPEMTLFMALHAISETARRLRPKQKANLAAMLAKSGAALPPENTESP